MDAVRLHALRLSPVKTVNPYSGQGSHTNEIYSDRGYDKKRLT